MPYGDLGLKMSRYRRWISMIQMWNHFVQMGRLANQCSCETEVTGQPKLRKSVKSLVLNINSTT